MWKVILSAKVEKARKKLPRTIDEIFDLLLQDLEKSGPIRGDWQGFGKLADGRLHCHLRKGRPTYVVVWAEAKAQTIKIIEVLYVGTHEKAPY